MKLKRIFALLPYTETSIVDNLVQTCNSTHVCSEVGVCMCVVSDRHYHIMSYLFCLITLTFSDCLFIRRLSLKYLDEFDVV